MSASTRGAGRAATVATRSAQLLELRKAGMTYQAIGNALGMTRQAAHKAVTKALRELVNHTAEDAAEVRALELLRLDAMLAGLWAQATRGNLGAVDRALRIAERRAKITGIDAPTKVAPTTNDGDDLGSVTRGVFIVPPEAESVDAWLESVRKYKASAANTAPEPYALERFPHDNGEHA